VLARLAWRSIWRHRRRTVITVSSIAFGLACVIFAVAVNEGIYAQLVDDAVRMQAGHVAVEHRDYRDAPAIDLTVAGAGDLGRQIAAIDGVESVKFLAVGQGVARTGAGAVGVALIGVEPRVESQTSPLAHKIISGTYLAAEDESRVVVGRHLADRLDLEVGKKLVVATNDASGELVEALFRVGGIFATGAEEIDGFLVQAPLAAMQRLLGLDAGEVTQVGAILEDPDDQARVAGAVRALPAAAGAAVRGWQDVSPELDAFIRMDRISDRFFLALLLVLVCFTIFNTILMSVLERERETAVMMAIGTSRRDVALQIMFESAWIGLIGVAAGLLFGGAIALYVQARGLDMGSVWDEGMTISGLSLSSTIYAKVSIEILGVLALVVLSATLVLSVGPILRAVRVSIADALRAA
jgi:ABC-type lipoprotein release transport system permease subunit